MRIIFLLIIVCLNSLTLSAQSPNTYSSNQDADPKAKALLKQVKDNLAIDKGVEINFSFIYTPAEAKPTVQKGNLQIKGRKFHLSVADQELFSDQTTLWTYLKKRNEVQLQDAENIEKDPMSPFKLLQIHDSPEFTYVYAGSDKKGTETLDIIEFKPLDKNAEFFKIKVDIDHDKKQYKKLVLYLKNGDIYTLSIDSQLKKSFSDAAFSFDTKKHMGVKTEDLR
ncbi:MAG: outer membrane lipoprotein carrier protein LolA [Saprospiraceae bacterium]